MKGLIMTMYNKKPSEAANKHNVLNVLYKQASHHVRNNADATILLGGRPGTTVIRALKHIVGDTKTLNGYEYDADTWQRLKDTMFLQNKNQMLRRQKKTKVNLNYINADVTWAPSTTFEDIDLCSAWEGYGYMAKYTSKKNWTNHIRAASGVNLMATRLAMQKQLKNKKKVFMGTICVWGSPAINKNVAAFSIKCLDHIVRVLGWTIADIDGVTDGYGKGKILPGSYSVIRLKKGKSKFRAHRHDVKVYPLTDGAAEVVRNCKVKMFTYKDSTPMLTFMIMYN
jgi:hypothetical protein